MKKFLLVKKEFLVQYGLEYLASLGIEGRDSYLVATEIGEMAITARYCRTRIDSGEVCAVFDPFGLWGIHATTELDSYILITLKPEVQFHNGDGSTTSPYELIIQ